ncbi:MAG: flagellar FlbD family protein [Acidimicrobiales bacterium]
MIALSRLNGERIAVNPDLVERVEETPETVIVLTTGTRQVVAESLDEVLEKVGTYRAALLARAHTLSTSAPERSLGLPLVTR